MQNKKRETMPTYTDSLLLEADSLIDGDRIKEAKELLTQIIQDNPDYGRAHNHLAWLYETKLKRFDRAEEHYKAAIKFAPEYPAGWLNYADLLRLLEKYEELEIVLNKMQSVKGLSKVRINAETAYMHEKRRDYDKAILFFQEAIKESFDNDEVERYKSAIERVKFKNTL